MQNVSFKTYSTILIEAIVVGVGLVVLVELLKIFNKNYLKNEMMLLFVAGFIFHVLCEYTGVNLWYAKNYCKLIV
jgi:hypothetical protein